MSEQSLLGTKVGVINGWFDGTNEGYDCSDQMPYWDYLIMVDSCYPIIDQ